MKRLAVLLLLAAFAGFTARLDAADGARPLPTGMAPTSPQVPAPVLVEGLPAAQGADWSRTSFRDRLGIGSAPVAATEAPSAGPRVWSRMTSWMPFGKKSGGSCEPYDPFLAKTKWCEPCAPVVRHPLPQLPAGLSTTRASTTGTCATMVAKDSGSCCAKLKDWMCFKYTTVRTPLIPTPKDPAPYTYFPMREGPGVGSAGTCSTGACATGKVGRGASGSCVACPTPGETLMPGYRLAAPETPAVAPVASTSYQAPRNR